MAYFHKYKVYKTIPSNYNKMPTTNYLPEITLFKQITITPLINQIIENLSVETTTSSKELSNLYDNYWDAYDYNDSEEITSLFH